MIADKKNKGIYPSLADKLSLLLGIPVIRLDYRQPSKSGYCTADVIASFDYLERQFQSTRFVVVGWSFGGSPCFTVAEREPERLCGVATVASQTASTSGVSKLSPRPLLLLHGTGDRVLSPACSKSLYQSYGTEGPRELKLFEGDDHGLSNHAEEAEELVFMFIAKTLGFGRLLENPEIASQARQDLVESKDRRILEMEQGHDLEGERLS